MSARDDNYAASIMRDIDRALAVLSVIEAKAQAEKTTDDADMVDALSLAVETLGNAVAELHDYELVHLDDVPRNPVDRVVAAMAGE